MDDITSSYSPVVCCLYPQINGGSSHRVLGPAHPLHPPCSAPNRADRFLCMLSIPQRWCFPETWIHVYIYICTHTYTITYVIVYNYIYRIDKCIYIYIYIYVRIQHEYTLISSNWTPQIDIDNQSKKEPSNHKITQNQHNTQKKTHGIIINTHHSRTVPLKNLEKFLPAPARSKRNRAGVQGNAL